MSYRHEERWWTLDHARALDRGDTLCHLRAEFNIPTRATLQAQRWSDVAQASAATTQTPPSSAPAHAAASTSASAAPPPSPPCIYLCGNSTGLQPHRTTLRIQQHLTTWATRGVFGHSKPLADSPLPMWLDADARAAAAVAPLVGARPAEVAVMQTLSANLHLLMCAFYRPEISGRYQILLEGRAFPSDHILHHGLDPAKALVTIKSSSSHEEGTAGRDHQASSPILTTEEILTTIEAHAASAAILLLPGIQYFTGQFFDIRTITAAAHRAGIFVIWDLAHAVGNVPLSLHDDDVDAAVWCSYKYLNAGPGAIGGLFVHERHTGVQPDSSDATPTEATASAAQPATASSLQTSKGWNNRLSGWWGNDKSTRFTMATEMGFRPAPGAAGFQLSNPPVLDITSLNASLEVFAMAGGIVPLREKSLRLTAYLERLLLRLVQEGSGADAEIDVDGAQGSPSSSSSSAPSPAPSSPAPPIRIITPTDPAARGAQLSIQFVPRTRPQHQHEHQHHDKDSNIDNDLATVMRELVARGVVVDERKPDVVRVAPTPLYNSFEDVWGFVQALREALEVVRRGEGERSGKDIIGEGVSRNEAKGAGEGAEAEAVPVAGEALCMTT